MFSRADCLFLCANVTASKKLYSTCATNFLNRMVCPIALTLVVVIGFFVQKHFKNYLKPLNNQLMCLKTWESASKIPPSLA